MPATKSNDPVFWTFGDDLVERNAWVSYFFPDRKANKQSPGHYTIPGGGSIQVWMGEVTIHGRARDRLGSPLLIFNRA